MKRRSVNPITGEVRIGGGFGDPTEALDLMGLPRYNYPHPVPPKNFRIYYNFKFGCFDLYWDDPRTDTRNSTHEIVGVNIYRSIDSSEGPYIKVNGDVIPVFFYRDTTETVDIVDEVVPQNMIRYERDWTTIKTERFPFFSRQNNYFETDLNNIKVVVDGVQVIPSSINPLTGEIVFSTKPVFDRAFMRKHDLGLPDGDSVVLVSYTYSNFILQKDYNVDQRIFYKCTSVNSEGVETPLDKAYEATYQDSDSLTHIWSNIISKQNFLLDQGGERAYIFVQKSIGTPCAKHDVTDESLYSDLRWRNCDKCFGTGYVGGYIGPIEVQIAPFDAETSYKHSRTGRVASKNNESFLTNFPVVRHGDVLVRQNGERYMIGPVKRKEPNGVLVQQNFTLFILQPLDILYKLPLSGMPKFDNGRNDSITLDRRYLDTNGKTPRYRNIHNLKADGID